MPNNSDPQNITLITLIGINIGFEIFRLIRSLIVSDNEKKNQRQLLIEEKRINVIEVLYKYLEKLSLYDETESEEMLQKIKEINRFVSKNKIYIPIKLQNHSSDIIDYFNRVLTDYRQKNIEKETKLFKQFCDEFNK